jgi:hypothetical protein
MYGIHSDKSRIMDHITVKLVAVSCECGYEPSDSIKCGEFLDQLRTRSLLRKDYAPWSKLKLNHTERMNVVRIYLTEDTY